MLDHQLISDIQESVSEEQFDDLTQSELEEELLNNVLVMRQMTVNISNQIKDDSEIVLELQTIQKVSRDSSAQNLSRLFDFNKMSSTMNAWSLFKKLVIAIVLFFITLIFIYIDSLMF